MIASQTGIAVESIETPLQINFKYEHLYTSLQFNIKNALTKPVKINKIALSRQDGIMVGSYEVHKFDSNETITGNYKSFLALAITTPEELAASSSETQKFWMMIPPSGIPAGAELNISVYVTTDEGGAAQDYVYTLKKAAPAGSGFERGANYTLELNVTDSPSSDAETWAFVINNAEQLAAFRDAVNGGNTYEGKTVRLAADIDLQNDEWTQSIDTDVNNSFKGTFEGDGYHISQLNVNKTGSGAGLFGYVNGGKVRNLRVSGTVTTTGGYAGGIAGGAYNNSTVENCIFSGTVQAGNGTVGGIVGDVNSGNSVIRCYTTGTTVEGSVWVGGIAGSNSESTISDCYSSATVKASVSIAGGIVGNNSGGTVTRCYATGTISSKALVGAIAGANSNSPLGGEETIVENCIALNPSLTKTEGTETTFGRIVGVNENGAISTNCAAFSNMTLPDGITATDDANGIHGASLTATECRAEATYTSRGFTTNNGWVFDTSRPFWSLPWNIVFEGFSDINLDYKITLPSHLQR